MKKIIVFCFTLVFILFLRTAFFNHPTVYQPGQSIDLEYTFLNEPKITNFNQVFYLDSLQILTPKYPEFHYGDKVKIQGKIQKISQFSKQNGKVTTQKQALIVKNPKITLVKNEQNFLPQKSLDFLSLAGFIRQRISGNFNSFLGKDEAGLLIGIVFGLKADFDKTYFNALKNTGVLHVIAASGMNVSMVAGFLLGLFTLFLNRKLALVFTIFAILFYTLISGFSPSIIRASIMAIFAYSAGIFGRQNYSYLSLFFAAFLMLLVSPNLIQDVGFQLSFFSTLGILTIKPMFNNRKITNVILSDSEGSQGLVLSPSKDSSALLQNDEINNYGFFQKVRRSSFFDDFTTTLSAQIATLPIMLFTFGSYSLISILVNLLVLWTIPPLMILGGIAASLSFVFPPLSALPLFLSLPFLLFFKKVVLFFSSLVKPVEVQNLPFTLIVGYYLLVLSLTLYFSKKVKSPKNSLELKG